MERPGEAPSTDHTILSIAAAPATALGDGANNNISIGNTLSEVPSGGARSARWLTIDGPLGLSEEESLGQARIFFRFGFLLLPWLWAVNCLYFWPVLWKSSAHPHPHPQLRYYVVGSAYGFLVFTALLSSWALTFALGGERLFGHVWNELLMYNVADRYGLTGWI